MIAGFESSGISFQLPGIQFSSDTDMTRIK
jgi:hypothetical protein